MMNVLGFAIQKTVNFIDKNYVPSNVTIENTIYGNSYFRIILNSNRYFLSTILNTLKTVFIKNMKPEAFFSAEMLCDKTRQILSSLP